MSRLTVLVTGANAGLGLGICERLLLELAEGIHSPFSGDRSADAIPLPCHALTLIMACRSLSRAEVARKSLYERLEAHISRVRSRPNYDGHADKFRDNLKIEIHLVDLSKMSSVFAFCKEISQLYSCITHMIFNAGAASWSHINWLLCAKQFFVDPKNWITSPNYHFQHVGETSEDGLGWVWQTNLFGHFVLFRELQPLLTSNASTSDARIIWLSSNTASSRAFDIADWQILNTAHSYESVKFEVDILATRLDQLAVATPAREKRVRHFVTHPSVCSTGFGTKISGQFGDFFKLLCFYIARWIGSTVHVILPVLGAMSILYAALAPIPEVEPKNIGRPVKYGTFVNRRGHPRVEAEEIDGWEGHEEDAGRLVELCDGLLRDLKNTST